ncbi:MAG: hypothetical protein WDO74_10485 [Pseudomonadota bacterium]
MPWGDADRLCLPFFFVRGAPPGNVGYFLDGIRVPLLFHIALGHRWCTPD